MRATALLPTRPVLRYHGGKWRIADWVIGHLPPHHTYVEPFGGAGSVLLRKPRSPIEVYNDIDDQVVSLFRVLRDPALAEQLRRAIELTPWARSEFHSCWGPDVGDPVEDARRLIVRTAQSVGAKRSLSRNGWRARASQKTPTDTWRGWPAQIPAYVDRLRDVLIESRPWQTILSIYDGPATVFYLDPPYMLGTRAWNHRKIYNCELTDEDHAELLQALAGVQGMVLLSGYRSELYDVALAAWMRVECHARAQGNRPRIETLWLNPAAAMATRQSPFEFSVTA